MNVCCVICEDVVGVVDIFGIDVGVVCCVEIVIGFVGSNLGFDVVWVF